MLLIVTATAREAAPLRDALAGDAIDGIPARVEVTGFARAATAFALSRLLLEPPSLVLQVGVGGTFDPARLAVGEVAVATRDTFADLGVRTDDGWIDAEELGFPTVTRGDESWFATFPCADGPTRRVADVLGIPAAPFATVETVTGSAAEAAAIHARTDALVESMEGAAAAHACLTAGVPFVQIRAASNVVGPRDRGSWRLDQAIDAASRAARRALPVLAATTSEEA